MKIEEKKYQSLLFDRPSDGVLRITMNRPDRLNATDETLHRELAEVWLDVNKDPSVSAAILTGAGRAFSAGGDYEMLKENIASSYKRAERWRQSRELVFNMIDCAKPIVSAVRGPAAGAGLSAALIADISIAANNAKLVDGHTRLGVAAGDHAAIIWPLLCGMAKAKYYLLLCDSISGEEAEQMGLISLSVDEEELEATSVSIAERLARGAPTALRWTKHSLNNWLRQAGPIFDASLALEFLGFAGDEVKEGLVAHLEKRAPVFDQDSPV